MEPKKSSAQHQPHAMEPKKSSPRGAGAVAATATEAESPLSSLFYPPAPAMVNRNGLLPKVIPRTQRTVNIHHLMIRHVLGHLCIMVVEIISTAALQPRKRQNPPLTTKGTRKIQSQILMATGGKAHFITKRTWWPLLGEQGTEGGQ
ncbi:uncharacterized protein [Zea mays]|uniref:Uncharacterized protein n=1 Tax=Zea mays TaxID=4577 RepID=B4FVU8_MAIZE|nr:uncharacterized protein LOC100273482 isoform X3 [Zea mays]ACF86241.1 unknown [Zea mays]|eukprot:XP_020405159.1 hypothetical protein [Zea mays]